MRSLKSSNPIGSTSTGDPASGGWGLTGPTRIVARSTLWGQSHDHLGQLQGRHPDLLWRLVREPPACGVLQDAEPVQPTDPAGVAAARGCRGLRLLDEER